MMNIKKIITMILTCVIVIANITFTPAATTESVTVKYGQTEARKMLNLINTMRVGEDAWYWNETNTQKITPKLSALTYDYDLEKVAMLRAAELAVKYSHTRPNGSVCFTALGDCGYEMPMAVGENILMGVNTAQNAHIIWSEEEEKYEGQGHRRNILSDQFKAFAVGYASYNGIGYWVEIFSASVQSSTPTEANDSLTTVKINTVASPSSTTQGEQSTTFMKKAPKVKVIPGKKKLKIKLIKVPGQKKIQIKYKKSTSKKWKIRTIKTTNDFTYTVKGLKSKKKYSVKARAYGKRNGKYIWGNWSKTISKKVK